ncbi:Hypothetical protein CpMEX30_1610 [Corynebacterium pseudotuberculosis]|uniref:Uncharacterized protein n=1 Tax=Corynebacterium pseudotuberculosis 258 TaxID=1168865 RepID=A0AAX1FM66_CORPS|nr:hypothetical protein CPCIP5297_07970 [Corynebacterium pseudotuberculosis CIP 52.97]AER69577.1 Hypothetical protein Cp106_1520 [Corynebacterium pseudotuberculosis 1/06-A]AFB72898.1 hypothetical protein CP316_07955 [Corynebacterium pseudotuberculosis 316]APQ54632.1 Hypothetical protein CpMEX30_1610 [Corynebacterium pseudotuberculosis]QGW56964.1 hypothetical protein CP258_07970 [Corynebacterium pseudotuberculosis 258]
MKVLLCSAVAQVGAVLLEAAKRFARRDRSTVTLTDCLSSRTDASTVFVSPEDNSKTDSLVNESLLDSWLAS